MKKILLITISLILITNFGIAQNLLRCSQNATAVELKNPLELYSSPKDEIELKHINGPVYYGLGRDDYDGDRYFHACISFTPAEMASYLGGQLTKIKIGSPGASLMPNIASDGHMFWLKNDLNGYALYTHSIDPPTPGTWNEYELPDIVTLGEGPFADGIFVMGFTIHLENLVSGMRAYPVGISRAADDPWVPGGCYIYTTTSPDSYDGPVAWQSFSEQGNLGLIGMVNIIPPEKDLAVSSVSHVGEEFKLTNELYLYTVNVTNLGSAPQNNYTVQMVDANENVLISQTITTALAPGEIKVVEFSYASTVAGNLNFRGKVICEGDAVPANNISGTRYFKMFPMTPMAYCSDTENVGGFGNTAGTNRVAIGYPQSDIAPFVDKVLHAIYFAIRDITYLDLQEDALVWVTTDAIDNEQVTVGGFKPVQGWNYYELDPPYVITNKDTYFGITVGAKTGGWPFAYTSNEPINLENATYWYRSDVWNPHDFGNNALIGVVANYCPAPTNLQVEYIKDGETCTAQLTWDAPTKDGEVYNIYRDGALIKPNISATTYIDDDFIATNSHKWRVTAVCEDGESMWVERSLDRCNGDAINENTGISFSIVPNPAKDKIIISAENNFNTVEVINFLGQTVISQSNDNNTTVELNVSNLTNGVYFVRITSEKGTNVKKFVKQ
jgi:hypothetical protein